MAPPKKWDEESESEETSSDESVQQPVAPTARRKFDDEEDSDDVADNWDEEEDSEVEREKAKKAAEAKAKADAEAAANKKSKAQRIEEHREANRRRRAEEDGETSDDDEDEADRRARLRKSEKDSDLKHAEDMFGDLALQGGKKTSSKAIVIEDKSNPGQAIDLSALSIFKPATKSQFEDLSKVLVPLLTASSSKPQYSIWVNNFVKSICAELPSTEIKKAASGLTALSNEKMKEEKAQEKGSKKSKAAKTKSTLAAGRDVGRGMADTTAYDDDGLEDDDFM